MRSNHAIVLFDGVCNLCTWSVQFILKRDAHRYFKFASMQSEAGRQLIADHGLPLEAMNTFVLIENARYLTQSDAAIEVTKHLTGGWPLLRVVSQTFRRVRGSATVKMSTDEIMALTRGDA